MKRLSLPALVTALGCTGALALTLPAPAHGQRMEGAVTFRMTDDDGKVSEMKQITKGQKVRIEGFGSDQGAWIMDPQTGRMMILDPKHKQAMVMTKQDMEQMRTMGAAVKKQYGKEKPGAEEADYKLDFKPTGESRTIAGTKCEVWRGYTEEDGDREEGEACLADGVGFAMFDMMSNPFMGGEKSKMEQEFARYRKLVGPDKGVIQTAEIKNGKPAVQMEATKIEKGPVPDAMFEAPAGYKVVNMGEMIQQQVKAMQQMQEEQKKGE
jgi:hypothetical protein